MLVPAFLRHLKPAANPPSRRLSLFVRFNSTLIQHGASATTPNRSSHLLKAIYEQNALLLDQVVMMAVGALIVSSITRRTVPRPLAFMSSFKACRPVLLCNVW